MALKVLFLTHDYPFPVTYGGAVYTGNVIKEWSQLASRFDVICFRKDSSKPELWQEAGIGWHTFPVPPAPSIVRQVATFQPRIATLNTHADILRAAEKLLSQCDYDYVIFDYIAIGWALQPLRAFIERMGKKRPSLVYVSHNVETILRQQIAENYKGGLVKRAAAQFDAWRAGLLERDLVTKCDLVTVETAEDAADMHRLFGPHTSLQLLPGYDGGIVDDHAITADMPRNVVVLGGRLSTMKQIVLDAFLDQAAEEIVNSGIGLHVVGPATDTYLASCRDRFPRVTFHGFVKDVRPLLSEMRVGVVADHVGGGFKHRILTYIFYRVPIIAVPEAMAGLPLTAGKDFLSVSSYAEIPAALEEAIDQVETLDRLQNNAFETCRAAFSWPRTVATFDEVMREFAQKPDQPEAGAGSGPAPR